jgi:hypothetical protein
MHRFVAEETSVDIVEISKVEYNSRVTVIYITQMFLKRLRKICTPVDDDMIE